MTRPRPLATIPSVAHYRHNVYEKSTTPRWIVIFGLQWQIIESHRLQPGADLLATMTKTIERLAGEGWRTESEPRFGFVYITKEGDRRLLMLTPKDPFDTRPQSFSPFKSYK
jgi:hypothetical protein